MLVAKSPGHYLLSIIYQDDYLIAVNKPPGLVCHPVGQHQGDSLLLRLRFYFGNEVKLLHRLDQDTSGVVLAAFRSDVMRPIHRQFEEHEIQKNYLALVYGKVIPSAGEISVPLFVDKIPSAIIQIKSKVDPNGSPAHTYYKVLASENNISLLEVRPRSGKKHQIRLHLASLGYPIVGDTIYRYGGLPFLWEQHCRRKPPWDNPLRGQGLHASSLEICHPVTKKTVSFHATIPDDWKSYLHRIWKKTSF